MSSPEFTSPDLQILEDLLKKAKAAGADAADAGAVKAFSKSVSWRNGELEDSEGSETQNIGLRVLIGKQQAMATSSDKSPAALAGLVERTIAMAKAVPEDPYCGLAPTADLYGPQSEAYGLDIQAYDDADLSVESLAGMASDAEQAALEVPAITTCDGVGASFGKSEIALMTSHGFQGSHRGSNYSISLSAVAEKDGAMERDYDFSNTRFAENLDAPELIGTRAGHKAVARLGATQMATGKYPIVYSPRVSRSLVGHVAAAISGSAVARGTSFLQDKMDEEIFADEIAIFDNPHLKRALGSSLFDGEGVATRPITLVEDGVLNSWMLNAATARQLGLATTGHGTTAMGSAPGIGSHNLFMAQGPHTPEELIADITDGFYVTELIGMGVNGVTGDYSRGAAGFRIQNGQFTESISEVTIAGNLLDMFKHMAAAKDLTFKYGTNAPTVRIDGMTLAGA